jgi:hypothetical protein
MPSSSGLGPALTGVAGQMPARNCDAGALIAYALSTHQKRASANRYLRRYLKPSTIYEPFEDTNKSSFFDLIKSINSGAGLAISGQPG